MSEAKIITDQDLASYVVCPHAWYLKSLYNDSDSIKKVSEHSVKSHETKKEWKRKNATIRELSKYKKQICFLLGCLTVLVMWIELFNKENFFTNYGHGIFSDVGYYIGENILHGHDLPIGIVVLFCLLAIIVFVYNRLDWKKDQITAEVSFQKRSPTAVTVSSKKEVEYKGDENIVSLKLNISGKPDEIIVEEDKHVPIIFQAFGNKVYDRHVIRLIAYQVILKELGKNTDYGLLILGQSRRRVIIHFSEKKQEWLMFVLKEMNNIREKVGFARAFPSKYKCKNCDVYNACKFRFSNNKGDILESEKSITYDDE